MIKDILFAAGGQQEQFFKPVGSVGNWQGVDCNLAGTLVVACNDTYSTTELIKRSGDSGETWTTVDITTLNGSGRQYNNVKCNADGFRLTAGGRFQNGSMQYGGMYITGTTGTAIQLTSTATTYKALGAHGGLNSESWKYGFIYKLNGNELHGIDGRGLSSYVNTNYIYGGGITKSSGSHMIIATIGSAGNNGELRYCVTPHESPPSFITLTGAGSRAFYDAKTSWNGVKMAAAVYGDGVYVSVNSGTTWAKKTTGAINTFKIAMSEDGNVIAALADTPSRMLISKDSGNTWSEKLLPAGATELCLSENGSVGYVACTPSSFIHKFNP